MRRCGRVPARQASACRLCLSHWSAARAQTRSQATSPTAAAHVSRAGGGGSGGDCTGGAAASPASAAATAATAATVAGGEGAVPAAVPHVPHASATSTAPASSASVAEVTERLRAALRALSEVEQAKADRARRKAAAAASSSSPDTHTISDVRVSGAGGTTAPSTTSAPRTGGGADAAHASGAVQPGSAVSEAGRPAPASDVAATVATAAAPASGSWIRNKKPKFWAIVNDAGHDDAEHGGHDAPAAAAPGTNNTRSDNPTSPSTTLPPTATATATAGAPSPTPTPVVPLQPTSATLSSAAAAAAAGRVVAVPTSAMAPFRSPYKRNVAHVLSELLSSDAELGAQLLGQLSAESRRLLLIMGTATEYLGVDYEDVAEQVKEADTDRDNSISSLEYDAWVRRMANSTPAKRRHADTVPPQPPSSPGAAMAQPESRSAGAGAAAPSVAASSTPAPASVPATPAAVPGAPLATFANRGAQGGSISSSSSNSSSSNSNSSSDGGGGGSRPSASSNAGTLQRAPSTAGAGVVTPVSPPSPSPRAAAAPPIAVGGTTTTTTAAVVASATRAPSHIPWSTFARLVVSAAPPFLAFGMLDNCTLVLAGGAIDNALSGSLGLTQMAAASLGGVVSGVAGIQVHGLAERYTRATPPHVTAEQQRSASYSRATQAGNTLGMVLGLILGMAPLLFMGGSAQLAEQEERDRHHFRQEAARSHQRRCRAVEKDEVKRRHQLCEEAAAEWAALHRALAESAEHLSSPSAPLGGLNKEHA